MLMFYSSIREEEKKSYERKGAVIKTFAIQGSIEETETDFIDLDVRESENGVELALVEKETTERKDFCLINRLGFYMGNDVRLRILFVGKDKMLVEVVSGAVFLRSENVPDKEPTFHIQRDMELIESNQIDMAMLLDPMQTLDKILKEHVIWVTAEQLFDIVKNSRLRSFPEYSDAFPQDYYYELNISSLVKRDSNSSLNSGISVKCLDYTDLSLGKTDEHKAKLDKIEERRSEIAKQRKVREQELERQRALAYLKSLGSGLTASAEYDDEDGDDDYDYNW